MLWKATFLLLWAVFVKGSVPGTTQTHSGYDTELGKDAVCWTGKSTALATGELNATITPFPNPVIENFTLYGDTKLLLECPSGITLKAFAPPEFGTPPGYHDGIRPRTKVWYNFTVRFTLDLSQVQGDTLLSDDTPTVVAIQVSAHDMHACDFHGHLCSHAATRLLPL